MDITMRIILLAAVFVLSSCASSPGKNEKFVDASLPIKNQLYGFLEETPNGYRFTKISNSIDQSRMEPWVDLKRGLPTWDYKETYCDKELILKNAATDCSQLPKNLFLIRKIDKSMHLLTRQLTISLMRHN